MTVVKKQRAARSNKIPVVLSAAFVCWFVASSTLYIPVQLDVKPIDCQVAFPKKISVEGLREVAYSPVSKKSAGPFSPVSKERSVGGLREVAFSPVSKKISVEEPREVALSAIPKKISVVLRTWSKDAALAILGLETVVEQMGPQWVEEIVIFTDKDSAEAVKTLLFEPFIQNLPSSFNVPVRMEIEELFLMNGHLQQKYSKMTADTYTSGSYILHIDSDCAVVQWHNDCFLKDGKPVNDFDKFDNLPKNVRIWQNGTQKTLGIDYEPYEFSRLNQHVYPKELYKVLRDRVEEVHKVPFKEAFTKLRLIGTGNGMKDRTNYTLVSDFNLLGATSYHFAPELMYQKNLMNEAWRPICIVQCNARRNGSEKCRAWLEKQKDAAKRGMQPAANSDSYENGKPKDLAA